MKKRSYPESCVHWPSLSDEIGSWKKYLTGRCLNAVLEHVVNPEEVMTEFRRVLRPEGYLYLCVPFLQPYHPDPTDYQRYTRDGLVSLVEKYGFKVLEAEAVHTVHHTLGWILDVWLCPKTDWKHRILRNILFPIVRNRTKHSKEKNPDIASGVRLIATRC